MNFSLATLCKQSAAQIFYLRKHQDKIIVTPEQLEGIKKQAKVSTSKFLEMCGMVSKAGHNFYFSWDEVKEKSGGVLHFIEHKANLGASEDWYLQKSLLQTAIYGALTVKTNKLKTAKFFVNKGNAERRIDTRGASRRFYLNFGGDLYRLKLKNSDKLEAFVISKALSSIYYDTAISFDKQFKHREFDKLKDCFSYNLCK